MAYSDPAKAKAAKQRQYLNRQEHYQERARSRNSAKRAAIREYLLDYLLGHPCVDCGEGDPVVLDFDHVGKKTFNLARAITDVVSLERITAEISQCEVRCANCHRRKTHRTLGYQSRLVVSALRAPAAIARGEVR